MLFFVSLAVLAFASGFFSSYLGLGSGLLIVSLLPGFSPAGTIQVSLILLFFTTGSNSLIFLYKRLVAWDWVWPLIFTGALFAFLGGSLTGRFSDFQIRFLLWCFLGFIVAVPFIKKRILKKRKNSVLKLKVFAGSLMGLCSGLSGLSGGLILSPLLHESEALPFKKIAPSVSVVTWFFCCFRHFRPEVAGLFHLGSGPVSEGFPDFTFVCFFGAGGRPLSS